MAKKYKKSNYNFFYKQGEGNRIAYNTRSISLSILNEEEFNIYENIDIEENNLENHEVINELYQHGYLIDNDCDELQLLKYRLQKGRYSKDLLRLTIAPTLACNFRCPYCYEIGGDEKSMDFLSLEVQDKLIEFIDKRTDTCKEISLVWYGGEPLLAFDIIKSLSMKILEICKSKNIKYSALIVTNGYLLNKHTPDEFLQIGIDSIQVTLDGSEKFHNQRRILKNGTGTYRTIVQNLKVFEKKIKIIVRTNLDKNNVEDLNNFIGDLKKQELTNYIVNLAPVTNADDPNDLTCYGIKEFSEMWVQFNNKCIKNGLNPGSGIIPKSAYYCDADFENGFIIDNLGYIYKCWRDIGITKKSIGNLCGDEYKNKKLYFDYMTYDATEDPKCTKCKFLPICMGGCPFDRIKNVERCCRYKYVLENIITNLVYADEEV